MDHNLQCTDYQIDFLNSTATNTLLLGGIGSGKSFIGALKTILLAQQYYKKTDKQGRGLRGMICANTYTQLMEASVETLRGLLEMFGLDYKATLSGSKKHISFLGSRWALYSLEKYDNIRGIEVDYIWADEICFAKEEAFKVIKGRLRAKVAKIREIFMTSSPNGFNWCYDRFEGKDNLTKYHEEYHKNKLIRAKTKENIFLPDGYYDELLEDYGGEESPLARQELFGEFVSLTDGAIYWGFDRDKHVIDCKLDKRYPVYVGLDFNIDNMNAVYVQFIGGKFYMCKEVSLRYSNAGTYEMGGQIMKDLEGFTHFIIPDSTGKNRSTTSYNSESNLQILRDMGFRLMDTYNPKIRSRQTTVNNHFFKGKLFLDHSCKETRKDIETLNGRDKEGLISHLAVALGYVCWKIDPIKRLGEKTTIHNY